MRKAVILILVLFCIGASGQVKRIGTPKIRNYSRSVYNASTQNWGIAQDQNGFMYFANNDGILRFDGMHWDLIRVSSSSPVRSVCIDGQNQIYVGFYNDFGVLKINKSGQMYFESLRNLLPNEINDFDEIWKIHEIPQGIVFQSFDYMFLLRNNKIEVIHPKQRFHFSFNVDGRLFLHEPGIGLFEYINGIVGKVPWATELNEIVIWSILEIRDNDLLIVTSRNGIYKFENGRLEKWDTPANEMVEEYKLHSAVKIGENNFAFGTILGGVIICDSDGEILQHISRDRGLQNNTVLSLFSDKHKNLWLGLDNGIDYIEINSPLTYITDYEGLGTGYCASIFEGKLYLGTNQGLFVKPFSNFSRNDEKFRLVENTAGQVWTLHVFNNQLVCGHHLGTYVIEGDIAKKISKEEGGWDYITLKNNPNLLLGGHYKGLQLFKKSKSGWEYFSNIKGFNESSRFLMQDSKEVIWMSHGGKGVFRIKLNIDSDSAVYQRLYNSDDGLPSDEKNILFSFKGDPYISTVEGIYRFDEANNKFVPEDKLNQLFSFNGRLKTLETDNFGNIWFISDNESGVFRLNEDLTYSRITSPFKQLDGKYVTEFEFIYPYSNDHVFIGLDNGFAHYSSKFIKSYSQQYQSYITKVELPYIDSTLYLVNMNFDETFKFPFRKNSFRFHYTAPFYENQQQLVFSYFLENYDDIWSEWSSDVYKDFTNLKEGEYAFRLKARNIYDIESSVSEFSFEIKPPWHRSAIAYYAYAFLIALLVFLIVKFVLFRLNLAKKRQAFKHAEELEKKEEEFQRQALVTEKEMVKLRNDKLRAEKIHRDKELANQTMNIIQKNKFLMRLNEELQRIQNSTDDAGVKTKMVLIKNRIKKELDNKQQHNLFETYFEDVHNEFFKRLKERFPQLTANDLKLCAYIRMNISTKEIATLLNISYRGVEIGRYRLRKKMDLSREINLSVFLSNI